MLVNETHTISEPAIPFTLWPNLVIKNIPTGAEKWILFGKKSYPKQINDIETLKDKHIKVM
jgi:hypothetical protein